MIPNRIARRLLETLFTRRQNNEIVDFMVLVAVSRARPYAVLKSLQSLERAGLVDARRLRLTLQGLAVASALLQPSSAASNSLPSSSLASSSLPSSPAPAPEPAPAPPMRGLARCAA